MPIPEQAAAGCPPGLEYLTTLGCVNVYQSVETFEVLTGHEGNNRYVVTNMENSHIYFADEGILLFGFIFK